MKKIENSFAVTGFVAKDAEIRQFTNASVARFPLSVARQEKNGEDTKRVSAFVNMEAWRKNENADSFDVLTKGTLLTVEGYFKPEEWADKDGVLHNRIVMVAVLPGRRKGGRTCGAGKDNEKGQEVNPALSRQSGLRAAFILLIAVSVLLSLISALSPTSLISLCEVKPGGNQQGAFHLRLTAIDSQARSGMFNPNAIVCDFPLPPCLVPFFPAWSFAREIKSPSDEVETSEERDEKASQTNIKIQEV